MIHILGNSTRCDECFYYRPKVAEEKGDFDGVCRKGSYVNGRKTSDRPVIVRACWGSGCCFWEDREDRLTHYEVTTRTPDPSRTPAEREFVMKKLYEARR